MDYRLLRIFVSSRMNELAEERRQIKAALAKRDINAWVFEDDAGATPGTIEQTYRDELEKADLYLGIFWRGFGQYTIEEYEYAEERGKDRLIYEKTVDIEGKRDPRLQAFLDRVGGNVKTGVTPARFDTVRRLVRRVVRDVAALQTVRFRARAAGPMIPFQAPEPRTGFVPRPALLDPLCETLAAERTPPVFRVVALHGMPGSGKSELAFAAAQDARVRNRYPDGVLWGILGLEPDLTELLTGWIQALGDFKWRGTDALSAQKYLRTLLQERGVLLVLDDAWSAEHIGQLITGGRRCTVLLTTREAVVAHTARAEPEDTIEVGAMNAEQALAVLAGGPDRALEAEAQAQALEVARAVGFLPLALTLARAQNADDVSWNELAHDLRSETQRLESLDDAALDKITDEATRRQLSLVASVTVSLRRLQPERLRQLAWLGVLPDDTSLSAAAAATLWGLDEEGARLALRSLRSSGLLLAGEPTADGALTYLPHDVIHAMAKRLLAAPATTTSASQLPGLALSSEAAQRAFLERHRARRKGTGWHTLPDDGYIYDHLIWHLERAHQTEEIHALLREQDDVGANGWFAAREKRGQTGAYASDLTQALRLAGRDLGSGLRYALMLASLRSLATAVPPSLVAALLKHDHWTLPQALAYANQSCNAGQRSRALALIAEQQTPSHRTALLLEAYTAARELNEKEYDAFRFLAGKLAAAGLKEEAIELARRAQRGDPRVSALMAVVEHLDADARAAVIGEAIEAAYETSELFRAAALAPLLPWLDAEQVRKLITDAAQFRSEFFKAQVVSNLIYSLAALGAVDEARVHAGSIAEPAYRARAFLALAKYLPEAQRIESTDQALATAAAISDKTHSDQFDAALSYLSQAAQAWVKASLAHTSWRTGLLAAVSDDLPPPVQRRALDLAFSDEDPLSVAHNFVALAPHLDAPLRSDGLRQVVEKLAAADAKYLIVLGLAALLPFAGAARADLLERAWQTLGAASLHAYDYPNPLLSLLPALEDTELERALEIVATFDDIDLRSQAIESLAPRLPARLLPRALEVARAIADREERVFAQASLAGHLDVSAAEEVLGHAGELRTGYPGAALLSQFPPSIAAALVEQALQADLQGSEKRKFGPWPLQTYAPLVAAPRRAELFQQAVDAVVSGGDLWCMCDVLSAAAGLLEPWQVKSMLERLTETGERLPDLPAGHAAVRLRIAAWPSLDARAKASTLDAAFSQLSEQGDKPNRSLLEFLAKESDPPAFDRLVALVDGIADPEEKALACGHLLPAAPAALREKLVGMALADFKKIEADEHLTQYEKQQCVGAWILPYASDPGRALEVIATFEAAHWRAEALIRSAKHLGRELFGKALEIARTLEPDNRGRALLALEPAAPDSSRMALLKEAWSAMVAAKYGDDLLRVRELTEKLCKLERSVLADFLREGLLDLAGLPRQSLLVKLKHLAPAVVHAGGTEAVREVYRAIDDVGRW